MKLDPPADTAASDSARGEGRPCAASALQLVTLQRVFEPFFTPKDSGTGLGLALVQQLIQAHDVEISLENAATCGVRATVVLPVKEPAAG
jgi:nitrogen fixation/metabolism regulation signal transduction histidine kinase